MSANPWVAAVGEEGSKFHEDNSEKCVVGYGPMELGERFERARGLLLVLSLAELRGISACPHCIVNGGECEFQAIPAYAHFCAVAQRTIR